MVSTMCPPTLLHKRIPSAPFEQLPPDLLLEITSHLSERTDRLQLSFTSPHVYPKVIPSVYDTVKLDGHTQCFNTLSMLRDTPFLARHVKSLEIRNSFNRPCCRAQDDHYSCSSTAELVRDVAPSMDALQTFTWAVCLGHSADTMWDALRNHCPNLKHLAVTALNASPYLERLSTFADLNTLMLKTRPAEGQPNTLASLSEHHLDILILHCPNLQSLTLDCAFDARLLTATWPRLHTLHLDTPTADPLALTSFLERHPSLTHLSLSPLIPIDLSFLSPSALPHLTHFTGTIDQLTALSHRGAASRAQTPSHPPAPSTARRFSLSNPQAQFPPSDANPLARSLQSLTITERIVVGQLTPFALYSVLVGLAGLRALQVAFDVRGEYALAGVLKTIIAARPELERVRVAVGGKASMSLDTYSTTLARLKSLRALSLAVVPSDEDERTPMPDAARRFALAHPRLAAIDIAYVASGTCPPPRHEEEEQRTRTGRFTVEHDACGLPTRMRGVETAPSGERTTSERWLTARAPPPSPALHAREGDDGKPLPLPLLPGLFPKEAHATAAAAAALGAVFAAKVVDAAVDGGNVHAAAVGLKAATAELGLRLPVLSALLLVVTICGSVAFE